mmetsp:Transcript_11312/g.16794  ORF Transcript_11312/g.16794 Transcript_11312/m.16794 type:complete len:254 (+) Transcript_11312:1486-2247(+)
MRAAPYPIMIGITGVMTENILSRVNLFDMVSSDEEKLSETIASVSTCFSFSDDDELSDTIASVSASSSFTDTASSITSSSAGSDLLDSMTFTSSSAATGGASVFIFSVCTSCVLTSSSGRAISSATSPESTSTGSNRTLSFDGTILDSDMVSASAMDEVYITLTRIPRQRVLRNKMVPIVTTTARFPKPRLLLLPSPLVLSFIILMPACEKISPAMLIGDAGMLAGVAPPAIFTGVVLDVGNVHVVLFDTGSK